MRRRQKTIKVYALLLDLLRSLKLSLKHVPYDVEAPPITLYYVADEDVHSVRVPSTWTD